MSTPDINSLQSYGNGTYNVAFDAKNDAKDGTYTVTKAGDSYTISKDGVAQVSTGNFSEVSSFFAEGEVSSISTPKTPVTSPASKIITDDDIRALMNLLLKAFTLMINAQRQGDLNDMQGVLNALNTKLEAMEESKDAAYNAAVKQAVGQMVSGAFTIVGGCFQAGGAMKGTVKTGGEPIPVNDATGNGGQVAGVTPEVTEDFGAVGAGWSGVSQGCGTMSQAACSLDAASDTKEQQEAEIDKERANSQLEFWKQGESMDEKSMDSFFNFLKTILAMLQEYRQNAANTEQSIARMS
ncbi:MAG: hypothetical protein LBF43_03975 [Puniceicoccales bacterium]|jgi:hypothetical protein|nr:hypothetical protein [Puniceicoccales bacterium]